MSIFPYKNPKLSIKIDRFHHIKFIPILQKLVPQLYKGLANYKGGQETNWAEPTITKTLQLARVGMNLPRAQANHQLSDFKK